MSTFETAGPFSDEQIDRIRLANAPLVRVLAQLRFTGQLTALLGPNPVAKFADAFADAGYPTIDSAQQLNIQITPDGVTSVPGGPLWNLTSSDGAWEVSLTPEFVTLSTGRYTDREDCVERLRDIVDALARSIRIPNVSRVGYRYVNRVEGLSPQELRPMIREALHAGLAVPEGHAHLYGSLTEMTFSLGAADNPGGVGDGLLARCGHLQAGVVLDPSIPAINEKSWVLDIDAFRHANIDFDGDTVTTSVLAMADRAYRFFRWSVTDPFLDRFGGVS